LVNRTDRSGLIAQVWLPGGDDSLHGKVAQG